MATTEQQPETKVIPGAGEQFEPTMSDEFATAALARAERLERFLPGITITQLAVVLVLAAVYLVTSLYPLHHTDLWAHLGYGRAMINAGELLTAEPFGVAAANQTFVNVPWLAQIVGFEVYNWTGPTGLRLLHAMLATVAILLMMLAVRSRSVTWPLAILAAVVAYLLSSTVVGVIRPQLVGMVALPLVLLAVQQIKIGRSPLFWLPPAMLLWANLHGSFVLGLFVLFVMLGESAWTARRRLGGWSAALSTKVNRRLALLTALSLIATLINPLGLKLWVAVLGFSRQANLADIVEWRPLVINSFGGVMFFATLAVTAVLLRLSPRRFRLSEIVLLCAFGLATLLSMRMLTWWALIWPWVMAPHLLAAWRAKWGRAGWQAPDEKPIRTLIAVAAIFMVIVWAPASHAWLVNQPMNDAEATNVGTPILLVEAIEEHNVSGKVFCPMEWADYLIWKTDAGVQPFIYSHVHLIEPEAWNGYRQIAGGAAGWLRYADQHEIKHIALRRSDPFAMVAWSHPRTSVTYQDQKSILFEIKPPEEAVTDEPSVPATEDGADVTAPAVAE